MSVIIPTDLAFKTLATAIKNDDEYAWTWYCNFLMPMIDSGCSRKKSEEACGRIMYNFFGVNICENKYKK